MNNDDNFNMYEALNKAIGNIKAQMTDFERVADEAEQTEADGPSRTRPFGLRHLSIPLLPAGRR